MNTSSHEDEFNNAASAKIAVLVISPARDTADAAPTKYRRSSARVRSAAPLSGPEVPEKPDVAPAPKASTGAATYGHR